MDTGPMTVDPGFSEATGSSNFGMILEWPDSEALLQSIISSDWTSLALPPGSGPMAPPPPIPPPLQPQPGESLPIPEPARSHYHEDPEQLSPDNGSREAVQSLSDMVSSLVCSHFASPTL